MILLFFLSLFSAACHEPELVEVCPLATAGGALATSTQIRLPRGVAVTLRFVPVRDDGKYMDGETGVSVRAKDISILGVEHVTASLDVSGCPGSEEGHWNYVLYGKSRGSTELAISVEGEALDPIPVEVY